MFRHRVHKQRVREPQQEAAHCTNYEFLETKLSRVSESPVCLLELRCAVFLRSFIKNCDECRITNIDSVRYKWLFAEKRQRTRKYIA